MRKPRPYRPHGTYRRWLERAWEHVQSVPYKVSLRWVFYRLLQDGICRTKEQYNNLNYALGRARKEFYKGWRPDTLADPTREPTYRATGYRDEEEIIEDLADSLEFSLDPFFRQENYVELWFEAKVMVGQFEHYTEGINLRPFGGHPSIPFKWQAAKELEYYDRRYSKPIVILYFGDLDDAGFTIMNSAVRDVRTWCEIGYKFKAVRCGLTPEQVEKYQLPENPERLGQYQWEALTDAQAAEIIRGSLEGILSRPNFGGEGGI